ncbi:hypothetical protein NDR87_18915 [Nocardia sp. CDC159]|uniref:Uncharacterized protein n=1 Tax=Nocardia pulmonis TaxID=2951408 RepID=A0A9X2E8S1_9NOCA|nr:MULTISPECIES: hypothetical protein [Nocardia]MCM6776237.1 hypothetical protein [Nocardia pulmonis]MCM6788437.1 hypothetical protein [Nocardia sp. CDC159]
MNAYPECIDFVNSLRSSELLIDRLIGNRVHRLADRELILEFVTELMTDNVPRSRAFEVAWSVWKLIGGIEAAA